MSLHGASLEFILVSEDMIYVDSWLLIISSVQWWETGVVWWGWSVVWCDILPLEWNIHLLQTLQSPHQFFIMPAKKKKSFSNATCSHWLLFSYFMFYLPLIQNQCLWLEKKNSLLVEPIWSVFLHLLSNNYWWSSLFRCVECWCMEDGGVVWLLTEINLQSLNTQRHTHYSY